MLPAEEWERCKPWIQAALERAGGTHRIDDIRAAIESGAMMLLAGKGAALVVEVHTYPLAKSLHIFLAGGDLQELKSADQQLGSMARALGCSRITIAGRRGFSRALKELGYAERWTVLSKEI